MALKSTNSTKSNVTVAENQHAGSADWQITMFEYDHPEGLQGQPFIAGLRSSKVEGYASKLSLYPGESIDFFVSTKPACPFTIDIYRMGYYGGKGGRHMLSMGEFPGVEQPVPHESIERLRSCNWSKATALTIPDDWVSGVYIAKLKLNAKRAVESYIIFVVKERRSTQVLVQVSDLTWQAYNKWPGHNSIYDDGTPHLWTSGLHVRVGFDRPYSKYCQIVDAPMSCGSGEFLLWEFPLAFWLEAEGYEVTYCSNMDLHNDPTLLEHCEVFISVGHDEYWTREMIEHAAQARDAGVSLMFFSGNALFHEIIPYEIDEQGAFRSFARKRLLLDAKELMGSSSYGPGYGAWTVKNAQHWVYEGTGVQEGEQIAGLIGWEYHGAPFKDVEGLEILAHGELIGNETILEIQGTDLTAIGDSKHAAVIYPGPHNNWVFNAGTIWWAEGLSSPPGHIPAKGTFGCPQGPDARIQQMTRNLLDRCIQGRRGSSI